MSAQADTGPGSDMSEPASFQQPLKAGPFLPDISPCSQRSRPFIPLIHPEHTKRALKSLQYVFFCFSFVFVFLFFFSIRQCTTRRGHGSPQERGEGGRSWLWVAGALVVGGEWAGWSESRP